MSVPGRTDDPVGRWLRDVLRAAHWHRRLLAAGLAAAAMAFGLDTFAPPPTGTVPVVTAARDLPVGAQLTTTDVDIARIAPGSAPDGVLSRLDPVLGQTVVSAVRRGELLTDARLLGSGAVEGLGDGLVAAPVRIADAESVALLRPGSIVDVLAAGAPARAGDGSGVAGSARLVAAAVRVLTVPAPAAGRLGPSLGEGALVLIATTSQTAARVAGASVTERLSVVVRRP